MKTMTTRGVTTTALRDPHLEYYLEVVEAHAATEARDIDTAALLPHYDNIRAALRWAIETGKRDEALRFCAGLILFWNVESRFREGLRFLEDTLAMPEGEPLLRAKAIYSRADLLLSLGRYAESEAAYVEARALFERVGDAVWTVKAEVGHAWSFWYRGLWEETAELLPSLLRRLDETDDVVLKARILELQGWTEANLGNADAAHAAFDRATASIEQTGDPLHIAEHLGVKASGLARLRRYDASEVARQRSADIYLAHAPASRELAFDLRKLADLRLRRGDVAGAEAATRQALAVVRGRDLAGEAWITSTMASFSLMRGEQDDARALLVDARELYDRAPELSGDDVWNRWSLDCSLASLAYELGDLEEATRRLERAFAESGQLYEDVTQVPDPLDTLATYALNRGDLEAALRYFARVAEIPRQSYERDFDMVRARALAMVRVLRGDVDGARAIAVEHLKAARSRSDPAWESQLAYELALVEYVAGDLDAAERSANEALATVRARGFRGGEVLSTLLLARIDVRGGDVDRAVARVAEIAGRAMGISDPAQRVEYALLRAHPIAETEPAAAAELVAAAVVLAERLDMRSEVLDGVLEPLRERLRSTLGDSFDEAWARGPDRPLQAVLVKVDPPESSRAVT